MKSLPLRCWDTIHLLRKHQVYIFFICQILKRESYHEKANKFVNIIHTRKNAYAWAKDNTETTPSRLLKHKRWKPFTPHRPNQWEANNLHVLDNAHINTQITLFWNSSSVIIPLSGWGRVSRFWMVRRYILACWVIPLSNICKRIMYCSRASPSLQTNTEFLIWTIMKYNSKEHNTASSF